MGDEAIQFAGNAQRRARIGEIHRTHLDRGCPGDQELRGILAGADPSQADHRNAHGLRGFIDHP